jgi:Domain of unknown function (DUF4429)
MEVKGIQGTVSFDGQMVTISKKQIGGTPVTRSLTVQQITGVTVKQANRLFHGYVQFLVAGSTAAPEKHGLMLGGRPDQSDMNSLSISRRSNEAAAKLVAAVEQARLNP